MRGYRVGSRLIAILRGEEGQSERREKRGWMGVGGREGGEMEVSVRRRGEGRGAGTQSSNKKKFDPNKTA